MAFVKFIEDICRYSFSTPNNYPLLIVIKTCLHRSFLTQPKLFDVVIKGVQIFVERVRESSLQLSMSFAQAPDAGQDAPIDERSVILNSQVEWLTYVSERIASKAAGPKKQVPQKKVALPRSKLKEKGTLTS